MVGLNEIIVIDDFFKYPDIFCNLSREIEYYHNFISPIPGVKIKSDQTQRPPGDWQGHRSDPLEIIDLDLYNQTKELIMDSVLPDHIRSFCKIELFLHLTPACIVYTDDWWHTDEHCHTAGVVYLNKEIPNDKGYGTILSTPKEKVIQNKFNRLLAYPSNTTHRPDACFGDTLENTRLTLTFFILDR